MRRQQSRAAAAAACAVGRGRGSDQACERELSECRRERRACQKSGSSVTNVL
jgi:hypothetical protein